MAKLDLSKMDHDQLLKLQKDVDQAIRTYEKRRIEEARAAVEARARELGFSLTELTGSKGKGTGGTGDAPTGPKWAPKSDIYIKKLPLPKKRPPKLQCPASRDQGIFGTVVLSIDVRNDGTIRRVRVIRGIGGGCDQIAKKAVKKMTLSPAMGTDGKKADYAGLRYEYVFDPPS